MKDERDERLTELNSLPREFVPPRELEDRVRHALRTRGLLRGDTPARRPLQMAAWAAAAVLLIACGWLARGLAPTASDRVADSGQYLLLLRQGTMAPTSSEEEAALVREYSAWALSLKREDRLVLAKKLADQAQFLSPAPPPARPASADTVQGFFLINAASMEEAESIARACPHLRHGGTIEVRPIDKT